MLQRAQPPCQFSAIYDLGVHPPDFQVRYASGLQTHHQGSDEDSKTGTHITSTCQGSKELVRV